MSKAEIQEKGLKKETGAEKFQVKQSPEEGCCSNKSSDTSVEVKPKKIIKLKDGEYRCGCCVDRARTLLDTIKSSPCSCCQFYLGGSSTGLSFAPFAEKDKEMTAKWCKENGRTFYIHCPLTANLAKTSDKKSAEVVGKQLDLLKGLPAACVLHVGRVSDRSETASLELIAERINSLDKAGHLKINTEDARVKYPLLLEVAAGQKNELGTNWEELRKLYEAIDKTKVGFCLDTAHAFASGMCDFKTEESVVKLFDAADEICRDGVSLVHLNDSERPWLSHVDRHAPLAKGHIWSKDTASLKTLIDRCHQESIDMVGETKDPLGDLTLLTKLME